MRRAVELRLTVAPSEPLITDLERSALDLVVCVEPPTAVNGITWSPLRSDELAVYAPPHVEVGPPRSWGPWVSFPASSYTRAVITSALRELGASFEVVAESHQPEVLREMVALGMGWTVLPIAQAGRLQPARDQPVAVRCLVIARRTAAAPHPVADALVALLAPERNAL